MLFVLNYYLNPRTQGLGALTSTAVARTSGYGHRTIPSSFLTWSLFLISIGQGGYNPSLQAFGADQIDDEEELPCSKDDDTSNKKTLFFQWWYFGICGGSLLGVTIMSYIQDTFGWVLGFAIPAISMGVSILIFACGSPIYLYKHHDRCKPKTSFVKFVQAVKACAFKWFRCGTKPSTEKSEMSELQ